MTASSSAPQIRSDLVLVGAGHTHVQVLRRWMMKPAPDVRVTVVLDRPEAVYSGMVPGFVAGEYAAHELEIDAVPLARRAGARVVLAPATRIDPVARRVEVEGRPSIPYDLASLDVGSTVRGLDVKGVREHALATRPIRRLIDELEARLDALSSRDASARPRIALVGGGAAGIELAFALESRLRAAGRPADLSVLTDEADILPGAPALARRVRREAATRDIALRTGARVAAVEKDRVLLASGEDWPCDLAVWATGAAPVPVIEASPLPVDDTGFVRVGADLSVVGHPELFAVGDCSRQEDHRWVPRAGVYAVRQGPVLDANLRARLAAEGGTARLRPYRPQRDFLSLLNLGDGRAVGGKWGAAWAGRGVWRLKDWIDRRFMRRFQVLAPGGGLSRDFPTPESMGMEEMDCGGCAAKVGPDPLARALGRLAPAASDESVVVGLDAPDDAAALRMPRGDVCARDGRRLPGVRRRPLPGGTGRRGERPVGRLRQGAGARATRSPWSPCPMRRPVASRSRSSRCCPACARRSIRWAPRWSVDTRPPGPSSSWGCR